ncbi:MAG TPA: hypothetical protein VII42_08175 [Caulobacteraceae bacterium]|jgi:hypothetical protein
MPFSRWVFGAALAFLAGSATAQAVGEPPSLAFDLHLHCLGATSVVREGPVSADDPMLVDITGDRGRIRIPHIMRHPGGDEGWRPLKDLKLDEHLITGHFALNLWNWPSVTIDRVTGRIALIGFHGFAFHGDCAAYDASTAQKF